MVDTDGDAAWDAAGCARFTYERGDGQVATMNDRRAPDDCYDDPDALREPALLGAGAGRRASRRKR